jgi:hypothetical protein
MRTDCPPRPGEGNYAPWKDAVVPLYVSYGSE